MHLLTSLLGRPGKKIALLLSMLLLLPKHGQFSLALKTGNQKCECNMSFLGVLISACWGWKVALKQKPFELLLSITIRHVGHDPLHVAQRC